MFRKAGQPDSAAQLLERASKAIETKQPYNSELMLEKAAETVETENRPIQAASYITKLLKISLERRDKRDAIKKSRKLVELFQVRNIILYRLPISLRSLLNISYFVQEAGHKPSTGRHVLGLVLLLLDSNLPGEAEIVAREFGNNCTLEQNVVIEDLLDAFDQNDETKVRCPRQKNILRLKMSSLLNLRIIQKPNPTLANTEARLFFQIQKAMGNKCLLTLDVEFKPYIDDLSLPKEMATLGIRPRSRSRRSFAKRSSEDKKPEESAAKDNTSTTNTVASSSDETEKKELAEGKLIEAGEAAQKKAPIYDGADMKLEDDEKESEKKDKMADLPKSKIPTKGKQRNPLVKMKTQADFGNNTPKKREPSAYIDVTTDSIERHRPSKLPPPAVYVDVEGVDPLQPAYMGMTVEQWREFKRANAHEEMDAGFDMGGIGGGFDDGDDGGF